MFENLHNLNNNVAFIDGDKKIKYSKLQKDVINLSNKIPTRSLFLIICNNSYQSIKNYIASIKNKYISILIDEKVNEEYLNEYISRYLPDFISVSNTIEINTKLYKVLIEDNHNIIYALKTKIDRYFNKDLAILIPTSGSTGSPKFVKLSFNNLNTNTKTIIKYLDITPNDKTILSLPFSYSYGLSIINTHIEKNATIILTAYSSIQKNFWDLFKKHKDITNFSNVPLVYQFLKQLKIKIFENKSFRFFCVAGGHLDYNTAKYIFENCKKNKIRFFIMYGQTEASPRMSFVRPSDLPNKLGSIGRPINMGKFSLINKQKYQKYKKNTVGELVYSGPNVFIGYSNNYHDLGLKSAKYKYLKTGDLAYIKNNNYYIVGRISRIIKCAGIRVNLDDIEKELINYNFHTAIIGTDDNMNIFIENESSKNQVMKILKTRYKIHPKFINIFLKKIPRLKSGKIDYKKLKNYHEKY